MRTTANVPLPTRAIRIGTKQGHEWTDVGDQALEWCVAAAALFGRRVGGEVFDEVVVVLSGKFDTDTVRFG